MTQTLQGRVVSGLGDFGKWIEPLRDHYQRITGMILYPGTLNIELDEPFELPPGCLRLEAAEYGGRVSVSIVPCRVLGRRAFLLRTDRNASGAGRHPLTIVEIATDVRLRDAFGLSDVDEVTIELTP